MSILLNEALQKHLVIRMVELPRSKGGLPLPFITAWSQMCITSGRLRFHLRRCTFMAQCFKWVKVINMHQALNKYISLSLFFFSLSLHWSCQFWGQHFVAFPTTNLQVYEKTLSKVTQRTTNIAHIWASLPETRDLHSWKWRWRSLMASFAPSLLSLFSALIKMKIIAGTT